MGAGVVVVTGVAGVAVPMVVTVPDPIGLAVDVALAKSERVEVADSVADTMNTGFADVVADSESVGIDVGSFTEADEVKVADALADTLTVGVAEVVADTARVGVAVGTASSAAAFGGSNPHTRLVTSRIGPTICRNPEPSHLRTGSISRTDLHGPVHRILQDHADLE